jgi:hypothetical protein
MSSTYSTNLAIELIGAGEQAGNWGSTTNTNLGTLIEQAISGYVTQAVATGTDTTITIPNGATGVARNMFIELTGTGGTNTNLIVPANRKLYYIYNNASGAVTVKVSGQTGVSVPVGAKITLVSNGTDIVTATNYMAGATFPSPTLTGVPTAPTASVGTNTTQIATTAFVQAAATPLATIANTLYPVGSIYTSTVSTNPASLFGVGTWVAFGAGRVLIGNGGGYSAGATGGSADAVVVSHTHTATVTDPGHFHDIGASQQVPFGTGGVNNPAKPGSTNSAQSNTKTTGVTVAISTTGVSGTDANLQPYVVVYMWNRTV